jgi:hypothetical protein
MTTETTLISYLKDSRDVTDDTPIGILILNYYVDHGAEPNSNVVRRLDRDGTYESLYEYDLQNNTLHDIPPSHVILTHSTFESAEECYDALSRLAKFLQTHDLSFFPQREVYEKVLSYLEAMRPPVVVAPVVVAGKRHNSRVPVRHGPAHTGFAHPVSILKRPTTVEVVEPVRTTRLGRDAVEVVEPVITNSRPGRGAVEPIITNSRLGRPSTVEVVQPIRTNTRGREVITEPVVPVRSRPYIPMTSRRVMDYSSEEDY